MLVLIEMWKRSKWNGQVYRHRKENQGKSDTFNLITSIVERVREEGKIHGSIQ